MEGERVFSEIQDPEVEPLKSRVSSSHLVIFALSLSFFLFGLILFVSNCREFLK